MILYVLHRKLYIVYFPALSYLGHKIRYLSQQRDNICLLMIHISFAFLSLSYLRVTPGWVAGPVYPGSDCLRLWRQKQSRIRHNKISSEPEPGDINNIIFLLARARMTMIEVSVPTLCRGKDRSLVKCPPECSQIDIQYLFSKYRRFLNSP